MSKISLFILDGRSQGRSHIQSIRKATLIKIPSCVFLHVPVVLLVATDLNAFQEQETYSVAYKTILLPGTLFEGVAKKQAA